MKHYLIANWKMNPTGLSDAHRLVTSYHLNRSRSRYEVVICPPNIFLTELSKRHRGDFSWGAQDCFWEAGGPYTGEVSAGMLRSLGAGYVIVGHSERREHLGETDAMINKKVLAVLRAQLSPIVCVGGGPAARNKQVNAQAIVGRQLTAALHGVNRVAAGKLKLLVAYEPPWAISGVSGNTPAPVGYALEMASYIRNLLIKKYGKPGKAVPVLYGGSITGDTVGKFFGNKECNGFLVGGASLKPKEFRKILEIQ